MTGIAFTVVAAVLVDVRPALDTAEYDGTSTGHLVGLYRAARDEDEQTQLAAAIRARSTALWGWLLDERTFQVLADAPNLPCLAE
jgi:hypothetical protein